MRPLNEIYNEKKRFVKDLNKTLTADGNIESLTYARDFVTGDEIMMIKDGTGTPHYINVTGNSLEAILSEANRFQLYPKYGVKPTGLIEDRMARKHYAKMFGGAA